MFCPHNFSFLWLVSLNAMIGGSQKDKDVVLVLFFHHSCHCDDYTVFFIFIILTVSHEINTFFSLRLIFLFIFDYKWFFSALCGALYLVDCKNIISLAYQLCEESFQSKFLSIINKKNVCSCSMNRTCLCRERV